MNKPQIGNNVVIGRDVQFGEDVVIGHNVVIYDGSIIGSNVIIQDNVVIGKQPTKAKNSVLKEIIQLPPSVIGNTVTIGTSSIIYAGAQILDDVFVADLATIRERVKIGQATIVGRGVAVENDCIIGMKCKLETNCYITAYSNLGDYVFVAPGVITSNDNYMGRSQKRFDEMKGITIKDGGRIGANVTTLPGIVIEEDGTVAAGSVVTKDVKKNDLVVGVPARKLRTVPEEQLLKNQK